MSGKKVVIIGSGINGLVAANYLSKKGFSVSVIEKIITLAGLALITLK